MQGKPLDRRSRTPPPTFASHKRPQRPDDACYSFGPQAQPRAGRSPPTRTRSPPRCSQVGARHPAGHGALRRRDPGRAPSSPPTPAPAGGARRPDRRRRHAPQGRAAARSSRRASGRRRRLRDRAAELPVRPGRAQRIARADRRRPVRDRPLGTEHQGRLRARSARTSATPTGCSTHRRPPTARCRSRSRLPGAASRRDSPTSRRPRPRSWPPPRRHRLAARDAQLGRPRPGARRRRWSCSLRSLIAVPPAPETTPAPPHRAATPPRDTERPSQERQSGLPLRQAPARRAPSAPSAARPTGSTSPFLLEQADMPLRAAELVLHPARRRASSSASSRPARSARHPHRADPARGRARCSRTSYVRRKAGKRPQDVRGSAAPTRSVAVAASLRAGHSFAQAMSTIVKDGPEPMAKEFGRVETETRLGRSTDDALQSMADRLAVEELRVRRARGQHPAPGRRLARRDPRHGRRHRARAASSSRARCKALTAMGRASAYVLRRDAVLPRRR